MQKKSVIAKNLGYQCKLHMLVDTMARTNDVLAAEKFFSDHPQEANAPWLYSVLCRAVCIGATAFVRWMLENTKMRSTLCDSETGLLRRPELHTELLRDIIIYGSHDTTLILLTYTNVDHSAVLLLALEHAEWEVAHTLLLRGAQWDKVYWPGVRFTHAEARFEVAKVEAARRNQERKRNCTASTCAFMRVMRYKGAPRDLTTHVARTLVWPARHNSSVKWERTPSVFESNGNIKKKLKFETF